MTDGDDNAGACRLIAINPTLRRQCEEMFPLLERAKEPADEVETLRVLIRHAPTYGLPPRREGEWGLFFSAYLDALEGLSEYALEEAFVRWNRGEGMKDPAMGQFFPKPSQLFALADVARREVYSAAYRARKALDYVDKQVAVQTPEEREANAAAIRKLMAQPQVKIPPQPPGISYIDWVRKCRAEGLTEANTPAYVPPRRTPQQVAAELRAMAADPGDVV